MEERGLVGIEARDADGEELGRISEVVTDEESGEVTHVLVERGEESLEVPIARLALDPEADFATVSADASDDEIDPEGYAPAESAVADKQHEGQLVSEPESPRESESAEDVDREDWSDEESTPADSGYPRTDAYIDPDTGETTESYPEAEDGELVEAAAQYLDGTEIEIASVEDGTVELSGSAATDEEIQVAIEGLMSLDRVREVDASGVVVG